MSTPGKLKFNYKQPYDGQDIVKQTDDFAFWGSPVLKQAGGTLICPGFSGRTFSNRPFERVVIAAAGFDENGNKSNPGTSLELDRTPGICEVSVRKGRRHDVKKAAGRDGGRITTHGIDPAEVEIHIRIWTPEQLKQLLYLWRAIFPPPQKTQTNNPGSKSAGNNKPAWQVKHINFELHGITALIFVGAEGMKPGRVAGERIFTMHAREFLPPGPKKVSVTSTPVAARATALDAPKIPQPAFNPKNTGAN